VFLRPVCRHRPGEKFVPLNNFKFPFHIPHYFRPSQC
jgi:hypothetical protein